MLRTECSNMFQNTSFSSPVEKNEGTFLDFHCKKKIELLKEKKKKVWGLYDLGPLGVLTLSIVHMEPSALCQLQIRSP